MADSLVDGQLVLCELQEAGVPARIFHGNAVGALGELPVINPEVWIDRDRDIDKARNVLERLNQQESRNQSVVCSRCEEENPPGFEICWLCHGILPVDQPAS